METPRKFIIAIINLRGVSTKLNKYIVFTMQTYKKLINKKLFNPVILQAQHFVCRNAFDVTVQTRVGGGLSPIFKHREELKIQGEAEYFLTSFEVF